MVAEGQFAGVLYAALPDQATFGDAVTSTLQRVADEGGGQVYLASRLEKRTECAVTAERSGIATALHDSVGAMLFSTGAELRARRALTETLSALLKLTRHGFRACGAGKRLGSPRDKVTALAHG
jgi:signal transduction histidine kinase